MSKHISPVSILLLLILGVATRLLPHPANFTSIGALALFGGLYLPKRWAIVAPIIIMFTSDKFIGFYSWPIMLSVYASFFIMGLIGLSLRNRKKIRLILGGTLLGSVLFFLITNWAVWAFGTMYAHSLTGLLESYFAALPFFRNSLAGDLFYTTVLVGGYEFITRRAGYRAAGIRAFDPLHSRV
ncbi:MAG: hypothetical protein UX39_C0012G0014 [Candidatus Magasanikbacteria bacterium GW2011_GWA2_46_17]|uniref:ECF transporter S component n=1 Tax=Candidatus Magasanikbacteria bacterium GW2011_GWA2_46_17 TaxID=1619042 RepID=A0A0G1P0K7_9BACT|nr:MAG: hypothetical protein UX39_C0012G0014 [Candidatus Magasanikbacteria bacterium GW2011_GWA2_46_17]